MKILISIAVILISTSVFADEVVSVASLEVKERIQSMEQINVSAPTDPVPERPTSAAVAELLDEASAIEAEEAAEQQVED